MTFTARAATADDHPFFARLFPVLGVSDPLPSREHFAERMLPRVLLLEDGEDPIAYAFWQVYGRRAHVVHLVVDPRARGRGAGREAMNAVRARVTDEGCDRWYLNVKRGNVPAIRLYEGCGLRYQLDVWAMRASWAEVCALRGADEAAEAFTPGAGDDAAIAARFAIDVERIALLRARAGYVLVALREREELAAFAAFDPASGRAFPFRAARPELAGRLLEAISASGLAAPPEAVDLIVEGDRSLFEALRAIGAEILLELVQMGGSLRNP